MSLAGPAEALRLGRAFGVHAHSKLPVTSSSFRGNSTPRAAGRAGCRRLHQSWSRDAAIVVVFWQRRGNRSKNRM